MRYVITCVPVRANVTEELCCVPLTALVLLVRVCSPGRRSVQDELSKELEEMESEMMEEELLEAPAVPAAAVKKSELLLACLQWST